MSHARGRRGRPAAPPWPRRPRRWRLLAGALTACAAVAVAWTWWESGPAAPAAPPRVLLITLDTTRADRLGSYGYASAATPHLDRLAAEGVRFARALSPAPLTLPAHASLMTGRQPYRHGVRNNGYFALADDVPTLATVFAAAGYDTAAFVSAFVLDRQFGLARGFATYDDALDPPASAQPASLELERRGDRTVAAAGQWLATRAAEGRTAPYFLWVHLYDAHDPYAPPEPFRQSFAARPYDGEVAFQDAQIGTLLQHAGHGTQPLLVVVAGDHGESLGEHGESTHGLFVYESALRVPLILSGAGVPGGGVVSEAVRLVDVAPTIAELAGVPPPAAADGRSLRALMAVRAPDEEAPPVYAETFFPQFFMGWSPLRSIRVGRWKYIDAPEPELYDLDADGAETYNRAAEDADTARALRRTLEASLASSARRQTPAPVSDRARERLASLGYVSAVSPPDALPEGPGGPDPKHMVATFERLLAGNRELSAARPGEAAAIAAEVLARDEGNAFARLLAGRAALALGRNAEAVDAFNAYLAHVPGSADAHHWMALARLRQGDRAQALAEEEAAVALDPGHAAAIALRAGLLFSAGRGDEAVASLAEAIERDPSHPSLPLDLADLLTDARRFDEAEAQYRRVLAARPNDARGLVGLALVLGATDRPEAALEPLTRALDVDERDEEARFARAEVYERLGRTDAARADYLRVAQTGQRPDLRAEAARRIGR